MKSTNTLEYLLKEGVGYRNEQFRNSGIINLREIIDFEVLELGNTDIFDTMKILYGDNGYQLNENNRLKNLLSYKINYTINFLVKMLDCINEDSLCGVWLTTYQNLYKYIDADTCTEIRKVYIHEQNMIPVSDLGTDGVLFAFNSDDNEYEYELI